MIKRDVKKRQLEIKVKKFDEQEGTFEGYAAVFGNVDSYGDIIQTGAFRSQLETQGVDRVKLLALHNDEWLPVGKITSLEEDNYGLYMIAKVSDTTMGRDILQLLRDGALDELSIGYIEIDSYEDENGNNCLTEIELHEVSIVTWAANEKAKILEVKKKGSKEAKTQSDVAEEIATHLVAIAGLLPFLYQKESEKDILEPESKKNIAKSKTGNTNPFVFKNKIKGNRSK